MPVPALKTVIHTYLKCINYRYVVGRVKPLFQVSQRRLRDSIRRILSWLRRLSRTAISTRSELLYIAQVHPSPHTYSEHLVCTCCLYSFWLKLCQPHVPDFHGRAPVPHRRATHLPNSSSSSCMSSETLRLFIISCSELWFPAISWEPSAWTPPEPARLVLLHYPPLLMKQAQTRRNQVNGDPARIPW